MMKENQFISFAANAFPHLWLHFSNQARSSCLLRSLEPASRLTRRLVMIHATQRSAAQRSSRVSTTPLCISSYTLLSHTLLSFLFFFYNIFSHRRTPGGSQASCKLNVLLLDGDALGVDGAEVCVVEEVDEEGFGCFLQGEEGLGLPSVGAVVARDGLGDFADLGAGC